MKTTWMIASPAIALMALQFFPVDRTLPASDPKEEFHTTANPPNAVMGLLKHACYDCHSNHTRYPWYARVQPVGWWLQNHVEAGRAQLNFSVFGQYSSEDQADILKQCSKLISGGSMPLKSYRWMHAGAQLDERQKNTLTDWLQEKVAALSGRAWIQGGSPRSDTCDDNDAHPRCCFLQAPDQLSSVLQIAPDDEAGERLVLRGRILRKDARTPYPDVRMYLYHTNAKGLYAGDGKEQGIHKFHGRLHGWLQTDAEGRYEIRSIRPASYPGRKSPAHIHAVVWEPESGKEPYYIEDFEFADDPLLPSRALAKARKDPGRTGVVAVQKTAAGVWEGRRDIVLE